MAARSGHSERGRRIRRRWAWAGLVLPSVITTLAVNVPINAATSRWDPEHPPPDWRATRQRWEQFQGIRTVPLLLAFILICLAISLDSQT